MKNSDIGISCIKQASLYFYQHFCLLACGCTRAIRHVYDAKLFNFNAANMRLQWWWSTEQSLVYRLSNHQPDGIKNGFTAVVSPQQSIVDTSSDIYGDYLGAPCLSLSIHKTKISYSTNNNTAFGFHNFGAQNGIRS